MPARVSSRYPCFPVVQHDCVEMGDGVLDPEAPRPPDGTDLHEQVKGHGAGRGGFPHELEGDARTPVRRYEGELPVPQNPVVARHDPAIRHVQIERRAHRVGPPRGAARRQAHQGPSHARIPYPVVLPRNHLMARLHFYRPPEEPALFVARLSHARMRIGRTDDCDVVLPDEAVSRLHCVLERRGDLWHLVDHSRNGTTHNGKRVEGNPLVAHDDLIGVGPFVVRIDLDAADDAEATERAQAERRDEEVLDVGDGLALREAWLVVSRGPGRGKRFRLRGARVGVGGEGSRLVLPDLRLVEDHVRVRLYQGRAMVEPGDGAAFLGPARVRDVLPLQPGEDVRIGDTEFNIEWTDRREDAEALRADQLGDLVGISDAMCAAFGMLRRMAAHHAPVLLIGESGTGKELAAKAVHDASPRAGRTFVALNCGAITATLFESELFGHEKGAFTGAGERRDGAFQRADGGTLFLDEVGELAEEAQAKLLRALESGEVRRVGGASPSFPDVRIVAATNRNLADAVREGSFRADLYFRLAVLAVRLPPLRERPEDIPIIARVIARRLHPHLEIAPDAVDALQRWPWPGNARELRNVLTRAWVLGGSSRIAARHLIFNPLEDGGPVEPAGRVVAPRSPAPAAAPRHAPFTPQGQVPEVRNAIDAAERELIEQALRRNGGNRTHTARELGIARSSLIYKLRRWGIEDT
jgi:DNA-binding NtrC family response regulator